MKRLLISAAIAALPGMAMADAKADEIARLKAQMQKLQQQMAELQKAVEAATAPAGGQKAAAAAAARTPTPS
ncbi:Protein of uncharacterised function (DUF3138) [Chromobacterium violaceum]|uniref:Protein of uncharacterized function (DUF3138) n=1 Tax=Chromobacterium violaceum TaxID=536 RepID=A0A3S4HHV6_CHRVL|nr:Protein of uncharacterised function (DUF3138) [Chromobacterium violaceum]